MRADILIDRLYKEASKAISDTIREETDDIAFHASPVQDIKKFRRSEDTSGNNKGKVVFVSRDPSFSAAFGIKWNDANARLVVETTNNKPPTNSNYKRTVLKVSEDVNIDAPCSMYKLRGDFKPLRCEDDIEEYTDKDVEIVSEEQFKSFKDMAEFYGLDLEKISKKQIIKEMEGKKTSNFEKGASVRDIIDNITRDTLYHNTASENVDHIKENGILATKANDDNTFTRTQMPDMDSSEFDDLVYLAKKKDVADEIGRTKAYYKAVSDGIFDYSPYSDAKMETAVSNMPSETLQVKAPLWQMRRAANPELLGAKTWQEYAEREKGITPEQAERAFDDFGNQTVVIKGDIPSKYITDSPNYEHAGMREVVDFLYSKIRSNKTASETIDTLYKEAVTDEYKNADKNQKQTMLKKMTQDAFDGNIPGTNDITEKDINVFRPWFVHPWNDSKRVIVKLKDENNETIMPVDMDSSIFAADGVAFTIKEKRPIPFIPKEDKHYSVMVDSIYLPEKNQRKGIGSASLKAVEDVANNLGISKIELIPDEKGPLVWGRPQFGYNITHDNGLKLIESDYKKYAKKHNLQIVESDKLSDYPDDFIKEFYDKHVLPLFLEKNLDNSEKSASELINSLYKQAMQEV